MTSLWSFLIFSVFALAATPAVSVPTPSEKFIWGIATSSYQTEESPTPGSPGFFETDWDMFFKAGKLKEPRGVGAMSFSQVDRDIAALKELGVSHYRFGIEWARVEPKPGVYSQEGWDHYRTLVAKLKKAGITPIVCLWHFTFPDWLTDLSNVTNNGWLHPLAKQRWAPYVDRVVEEMGPEVLLYAPQNEPNGQSLAGYFLGSFPPGGKFSLANFRKHLDAGADFYIEAAQRIKAKRPEAKIISIQNLIMWEKAWWDVISYFMKLGEEYNFSHLDKVAAHTDILGFNYYYRLKASPFDNPRLDDPQGLETLIDQVAERYRKPIIIMENGVADPGDDRRREYMKTHIDAVQRSIAKGRDVKGYFYWSLVDNFEWAHGYKEKFGLYSFEAASGKITPKESAKLFSKIIREQGVQNLDTRGSN